MHTNENPLGQQFQTNNKANNKRQKPGSKVSRNKAKKRFTWMLICTGLCNASLEFAYICVTIAAAVCMSTGCSLALVVYLSHGANVLLLLMPAFDFYIHFGVNKHFRLATFDNVFFGGCLYLCKRKNRPLRSREI